MYVKGLPNRALNCAKSCAALVMEKLLYFVGGIIVGSIGTLAALGFTEEKLDEMRQEEDESL